MFINLSIFNAKSKQGKRKTAELTKLKIVTDEKYSLHLSILFLVSSIITYLPNMPLKATVKTAT